MSGLQFDDDGYPTEETLEAIRDWPAPTLADYGHLLDAIQPLWRWPSYFRKAKRRHRSPGGSLCRRWYISTGGWSGHEDVIAALRDNQMFWVVCWVSSTRGGHYVFETREDAA